MTSEKGAYRATDCASNHRAQTAEVVTAAQAEAERLRQDYNVAIANGLVGKARVLGRALRAVEAAEPAAQEPGRPPSSEGTRIVECGLCGALAFDLSAGSLHRATCPPCNEHPFEPQWGRCDRCGHAEKAACHV